MGRFFPNEGGYSPGDAANPVAERVGRVPVVGSSSSAPHVPLLGVLALVGVVLLFEHGRLKRRR